MEAYKKVYEFAKIIETNLRSNDAWWDELSEYNDDELEVVVRGLSLHTMIKRKLTEEEKEAEKLAKIVFFSSFKKIRTKRPDFPINLAYQIADKIEANLRADTEMWNRVLAFNVKETRKFVSAYSFQAILNRLPTNDELRAKDMAKEIFISSARKAQIADKKMNDFTHLEDVIKTQIPSVSGNAPINNVSDKELLAHKKQTGPISSCSSKNDNNPSPSLINNQANTQNMVSD